MSWRKTFTDKVMRTRILSCLFALGVFASLPMPSETLSRKDFLLLALWVLSGFLAWACWYIPKMTGLVWVVCWVLSFVYWKWTGAALTVSLLSAWGIWRSLRMMRESKTLVALVACGLFAFTAQAQTKSPRSAPKKKATPAPAPAPSPEAIVEEVPKYLTGYALKDISSCSAIDQVPWKFRADSRKTRLLMRDQLRLNTEAQSALWEINQVMDKDGYVTYVFSKVKNGVRAESLLVKDNVFNRIANVGGRSRVVEVQDLRTLINRPVLIFNHSSGSTITYAPGLAGQSVLTVELRPTGGRPLAPIYIRGSFCERAQGNVNSVDLLGKDRGAEGDGKPESSSSAGSGL